MFANPIDGALPSGLHPIGNLHVQLEHRPEQPLGTHRRTDRELQTDPKKTKILSITLTKIRLTTKHMNNAKHI